ncbi:MAG: RNase adapter RapZ, partial [Ottowia sp.]|nr:RNase adapter RapZ [Ottowia sp.]
MHIVLVTGISGAGKSVALHMLEDVGYYCVDNLPICFIAELSASLEREDQAYLAVAIDARNAASIYSLPDIVQQLSDKHDIRLLFLDADTETLVQRFSETRRRHPLSTQSQTDGATSVSATHDMSTLIEAIERERVLLAPIAKLAHTLDTSKLHTNTLRNWVRDLIAHRGGGLTLLFESFGFKYGLPRDADFVFDARALPNPHYDRELQPLTGQDVAVQEFLRAQPVVLTMADDIRSFIEKWLPSFVVDHRSYLTI